MYEATGKNQEAFKAGLDSTGVPYKGNFVDHNSFQDAITTYLQQPDDVFTWLSGYRMRFFAEKGLLNIPQRCATCRIAAKRVRMTGPREYHAAVCNACGEQAMVPFAPRTDRPVYCSTCFDKVRAGLITPAPAPANA